MGAVWPVWPISVGVHSTYAAWRNSPADGGCGVGNHPCQHWGVDLRAAPGTKVYAPDDGEIVYAVEGPDSGGTPRPFRGFGPAVVVLRGADGLFHLLAHLRLGSLVHGVHEDSAGNPVRVSLPVRSGEVLGVVSGLNHTHWQVQTQPTIAGAPSWESITEDPIAWGKRRGAAPPGRPSSALVAIAVAFSLPILGHLRGRGIG